MTLKKSLTTIVILFMMIVTTPGSPIAMAEIVLPTEPIETAKMIEVELNDYYFKPENITITKGETTTLRLKNNGSLKHTFTVKDLNIDVVLEPGKVKTITVKPKNSGTYELICRFHTKEGMVGKVIVK